MIGENFNMPSDLNADGKRAYETIKKFLKGFKELDSGGCQSFYSPKEWNARGEEYGTRSVLIVCYDGGELRPYFNMDACYDGHCMLMDFLTSNGKDVSTFKGKAYDIYENLRNTLSAEGFTVEECTGWYSAVYKN